RADPAARARAHVEPAAARVERLDQRQTGELHRRARRAHGGADLRVLVQDPLDQLADRQPVEVGSARVRRLGDQAAAGRSLVGHLQSGPVSFRAEPATLARLEWPRLLELLAGQAATARGAEALRALDFPATHVSVRQRLAETSEARVLCDDGAEPPFGGAADLREPLAGLAGGGTFTARERALVAGTLEAQRRVRTSVVGNAGRAPLLAARAETLPELRALERALAEVITSAGELREDAS